MTPAVVMQRVADEDVRCPLCDYDLRGLAEPKCPECGYRFTWPEVLDPALRRHPYLFEHHSRRNLWSFWRTVRGGVRPNRFWSALHPSQPSHPGRLFLYWLLASAMLLLAAATPLAVTAAAINTQQRQFHRDIIRQFTSPQWNNDPRNAAVTRSLIATYGSVQKYADATARTDWRYAMRASLGGGAPVAIPFLAVAAWPWLTVAALMVFRISMRRARIRPVHVVRCVVYSFDGVFWLGLLSLLLAPVAAALMMFGGMFGQGFAPLAVTLLYLAAFLFMAWRLVVAYRLYLRFDHPVATVLASQVIVALFVVTATVNVMVAMSGGL
jgi:hypothetical protein